MCFWLGLEILRLIKKKCLLKYWMASILFDLLFSKKSSTAPYKSWKKFLRNWAYKVSKEAEFCADFKNEQKSRVWQKRKNVQKNWNFKDFFWEKIIGNFLTQEFYNFFEIRAKFRFFCYPLHPILNKFYKGRCSFFKVKSSKKIETVQ